MIYLKTDEEIELLREADLVVARTLGEMAKWVAPKSPHAGSTKLLKSISALKAVFQVSWVSTAIPPHSASRSTRQWCTASRPTTLLKTATSCRSTAAQ